MLSSLEVRAPFLDHRIIEFAFGRLPDRMRATEKPPENSPTPTGEAPAAADFDLERKQGFTMALAAWFKGEWGRYIESVLLAGDPCLFDRRRSGN